MLSASTNIVAGAAAGGVFVISIILLASATKGDGGPQLASPQPAGMEKFRIESLLKVDDAMVELHGPYGLWVV